MPSSVGSSGCVAVFDDYINENKDAPVALAAIHSLRTVIKDSEETTQRGLQEELRKAASLLHAHIPSRSMQMRAATEILMKYVTIEVPHCKDFKEQKQALIKRVDTVLESCKDSRTVIGTSGSRFIRDGAVVLTHSYSNVVMAVLLQAVANGKRFSVYVTEARPDSHGELTVKKLRDEGIQATLLLDAAVGAVMERIDIVLVGAEGVVENGGVINKIGSYQIAVLAKALKKPVYVAAESYKFARLYPLNQTDFQDMLVKAEGTGKSPAEAHVCPGTSSGTKSDVQDVPCFSPASDYTPPAYVTLLITDLGGACFATFAHAHSDE